MSFIEYLRNAFLPKYILIVTSFGLWLLGLKLSLEVYGIIGYIGFFIGGVCVIMIVDYFSSKYRVIKSSN